MRLGPVSVSLLSGIQSKDPEEDSPIGSTGQYTDIRPLQSCKHPIKYTEYRFWQRNTRIILLGRIETLRCMHAVSQSLMDYEMPIMPASFKPDCIPLFYEQSMGN